MMIFVWIAYFVNKTNMFVLLCWKCFPMTELISIFIPMQSLREVDYVVKEKSFLEKILDTEFLELSDKGIFYNGENN